MEIGAALKYYRRIGNLTQTQIAEKADINEKYYGELERNESSPTISKLDLICHALGVHMQQIVNYSPLKEFIVTGMQEKDLEREAYFYCNCCGTEFSSRLYIPECPVCGCSYDDDEDYIERYVL